MFRISPCGIHQKLCKLVQEFVKKSGHQCGTTYYTKLLKHTCTLNRCVQNNTVFKCTKNNANWFRHLEDVSSQTVALLFGPPCIVCRDVCRVCAVSPWPVYIETLHMIQR